MVANSGEMGGIVSPGSGVNADGVEMDDEEDEEEDAEEDEEDDDADISVGIRISVANNVPHRHKTDTYAKIETPETDNPLIFITFSPKNIQ
jgi:hypothetical protein